MGDKLVTVFSLIITGGIGIRILTNKNSADVIGTIFHGTAEDISASFGS
jgi:hypothetical protein